jgi:hypothetical protein
MFDNHMFWNAPEAVLVIITAQQFNRAHSVGFVERRGRPKKRLIDESLEDLLATNDAEALSVTIRNRNVTA